MGHGRAPAATLCHPAPPSPGQRGPSTTDTLYHHLPTPPGPSPCRAGGWRWLATLQPVPRAQIGAMPGKVMVLPALAQPLARPRGQRQPLANSLLSLHLVHPVRPRGSPYSTVPPRRRHGHLLAPRALGAEGKSRSGVAPAVFRGWMLAGCPGGSVPGGGDTLQPACRSPLGSASPRLPAHIARAVPDPAGSGHRCCLNVLV